MKTIGDGNPLQCTARGCMRNTKGGKPLCSKHVLDMPYAQGIAETLGQLDLETKSNRVRADGVLAEEVLVVLREGAKTSRCVARRICVPSSSVRKAMEALRRKGIVKTWETRKCGIAAELTERVA